MTFHPNIYVIRIPELRDSAVEILIDTLEREEILRIAHSKVISRGQASDEVRIICGHHRKKLQI